MVNNMDENNPTLINKLPQFDQLPAFIVQKNIDGLDGKNRAKNVTCQIRALNDYEAIQCWADEYKNTPSTHRSYTKEGLRLLLWCVVDLEKPFSSLDRHDLEKYFNFLANPQPRDFWCASKGGYAKKRGSKNWRPFEKGLSASAIATSISIINSLFEYLVLAQYFCNNPLRLMKDKKNYAYKVAQRKINVIERILEFDEWYTLLDTLEELPESNSRQKLDKARLRLAVYLLYFLGIRISELEKSTWNAFRELNDKWWFFVIGKGGKIGKIPVNDELLNSIKEYRTLMKMLEFPDINNETEHFIPIITNWNTGKALTARNINKLLKSLAIKTAEEFSKNPKTVKKAEKLKKFSAHWLRHLSASMQDVAGVSFKHIRENHRHASDETTRIYVHAFDDARHADMQKLKLRVSVDKDKLDENKE